MQKPVTLAAIACAATVVLSQAALAEPAPVCPEPEPESPTPTPMVTVTPETARQSASLTAGLIADRIGTVVAGLGTGATPTVTTASVVPCGVAMAEPGDQLASVPEDMAAPTAEAPRKAVWTGGSFTRVKKTDQGGEYSGGIANGIVGYDRVLMPGFVGGLALGIEGVDIDTHYNAGSVESTSYTLAPYLGYALTDWLTVDGSLGHTWIDYDFTRNTSITGSTDATRWFGSAGLTATQRFDASTVYGALGYLRLYEDQDGYVESNQTVVTGSSVNFGQARLTVGGSHQFDTGFGAIKPNGFVRYEYDTPHASAVSLGNGLVSSNDRSGFVFGLGTDVVVGDDLTFSLTGTTAVGRDNTTADSISADIRYTF